MQAKRSLSSRNNSGWLKVAAWASIALVIFTILFSIITSVVALSSGSQNTSTILSIIQSLVGFVLSGLFIFGFYKIGEKYNSKFLKVVAFLIILFYLIFLIVQYSYFNSIAADFSNSYLEKTATLSALEGSNITSSASEELSAQFFNSLANDPNFMSLAYTFFGLLLAYSLILGILNILLGVAFIKLGDKVKLAKVTGILLIVGVATCIILVGFFILIVAWIMQVILLFKEAYKK